VTPPLDRTAVPAIDVHEAGRRLDATTDGGPGALLVDVRELGEVVGGRADGAVLIPLSTFGHRYRELPADRSLLVICQSGYRSSLAAAYLAANGYPDALNVAGGMTAWERAGLPVRRGPLAPGEGEVPGSIDGGSQPVVATS
jgi:rhodanese-related sulfurtransferase